ncbi:PAS domain-containing protein [Hymenobacter sediminis]|uniref:sensor histidine kinase n=1 Tax=Hymenobacter sediminis TaxID=2218621 RepID=UPI000DA66A8C|nr:PAS domain-containing sensor histidine kinase [Hymenobacter sediminis]RPD44147.1 PAS domain-containing protein [Hymenobacter sediminis]
MSFPLFFQGLIHEARQVFFVYDLVLGQVTYVNPAYAAVLGGTPDQVNEELPALLARLHPEDAPYLQQRWQQWRQGQAVEEVAFRLCTPQGREQWLCLTPHVQLSPAGGGQVGGWLTDITVTKHQEINARKFNTKKNATLEILSHDLAGPFTLLLQMSDYLLERVQALQDPELNELLGVMQTTCADSVNLIRDFVDDEFMQSVNIELKRERIDIAQKLSQLMEEYQRSAAHLGKQFLYEPTQRPIYVHLDENKFQQVINNLISNAIKFTPDGGTIRLAVEQQADRLRLTVSDNGIGIADALHPILFERFTKARRPGLRGEKTTGLGMSIIKTIVELHEGRIWFESQQGEGATFFIELPIGE